MFSCQSHLIVYPVLVAAFVVLPLLRVRADVSQKAEMPRSYCGKDLAEAMTRACLGDSDTVSQTSGKETATNNYPRRWKSKAKAMTRRFVDATSHRQIRGIVDECCRNACSISDLQSYCDG